MPITLNGNGTITGYTVTTGQLPSGSVIKVYHNDSQTKVQGSANSWTVGPATLTVALTNSNNKLIIQSSNNIGATGDNEIAFALYKDSAVTGTATSTGYGIQGIAADGSSRGYDNRVNCTQFNFEHAPGDTNNHTYQIVAQQQVGTIRWNRSGNTSGDDSIETRSSITIYEVAA
tara:strand:+ start:1040 stop:1561 length:522 start_codon:yes stop_codon:yes gene_type:complete